MDEQTVYESYILPKILYGSEVWCLKDNKMEDLRIRERSMVRAKCGVQFEDGKKTEQLMLMLGLNETSDQLAIAKTVHWYCHVLWREDDHVLRRA